MNKEEWLCCDCPKYKANKHEELHSFGPYGNNPFKKEDSLKGNQRCEEHFSKIDKEFDENYSNVPFR